jgi:hypothetical protein
MLMVIHRTEVGCVSPLRAAGHGEGRGLAAARRGLTRLLPSVMLTAMALIIYINVMNTLAEIKEAIDKLSSSERAELEALLWPDEETPPRIREKLAAAAAGAFIPGHRANIDKILATLNESAL